MKRLCLILAAILLAAGPSAAVVVVPDTLDRELDPVVVRGDRLVDLAGRPIDRLGLFASVDGALSPIPFQIDERDADGDFVFPYGPKADPKAGDGLLGAGDELVFMAADAGASAPPPLWPDDWKAAAVIELTDPTDDGRAWAYLLAFDEPPAKSAVDYVAYDNRTATVTTDRYRMGFHPKATIGIGDLAVLPGGGGDGSDDVDRLKIRFSGKTIFGFTVNRQEEDFSSKTIAWIDGPVRVVRRTRNRMVLFWKIPSPASDIDNVYYRNSFEFPTRVELPFDAKSIFKSGEFRVSTDLDCDEVTGRVFRNENNPVGVTIDGRTDDAERALDARPYDWSSVAGRGENDRGGWLNRLVYDPTIAPIRPVLYYVDDETALDPPEDYPGQCGDIGYYLEGMVDVKKGMFELVSVLYQIPDDDPRTIRRALKVLDAPLAVAVRPVRSRADAPAPVP